MDLLNHDLAHEFPEYLQKMRSLKASDPKFSSLFAQYDADNHAIARYEQGVGAITDEALEDLKKSGSRSRTRFTRFSKNPEHPRSPDTCARLAGFSSNCHAAPVRWRMTGFRFLREKPLDSSNEELVRRIRNDLIDSYDEELEMELEDRSAAELTGEDDGRNPQDVLKDKEYRRQYFRELFRLQAELVKLQDWVVATGHKVVILFEGRDAAGKGGVIKRITQRLNPRVCRVAALPAPNDRERTQWYFQRYVSHLPAAGEIVLFDRSWYNRAGVERVMGFCTDEQYEEFFRTVPEFEKMLGRSGIQLIKYWFSISDEEQHLRFLGRIHDPLKQWKLSPMDLESRRRWEEYTKAKEIMLERTHIPEAPWWVVQAVDKKKARLNCIHHLLQQMPYQETEHPAIVLPDRVRHEDYVRNPVPQDIVVPEIY